MRSYVVRYAHGRRLFLDERGGVCALEKAARSPRFETPEAARAEIYDVSSRDVFEVSYVLAWYSDGKRDKEVPYPYFTGGHAEDGCNNRKAARSVTTCSRFDTREEAEKAAARWRYGLASRLSGWKPVTVLKRVKS